MLRFSYQLEETEDGNFLHYTGDGWHIAPLTEEQTRLYKSGELDILTLNWE
jgi:hypothetical protein